MTGIEKVLIKRDGLTKKESNDTLKEARANLVELMENPYFTYDDAVEFMEDEFGLEPDYIFDLI